MSAEMEGVETKLVHFLQNLTMVADVRPEHRLSDDLNMVSSDFLSVRRWVREAFAVDPGLEALSGAQSVRQLSLLVEELRSDLGECP